MSPTTRLLTRSLTLCSAVVALQAAAPRQAGPPMLGFTPESSARQLALEEQFDSYLDAGNLEEWMRFITSKPMYTGSPHNREVADWMVERFRSWGFDVRIDEYQVLFPTPRIRELELVSPTRYTAQLREPTLAEDATSGIEQDRLPTYNAYSADGDVTAELVYVNYGIPSDYEELERRGIDVEGKIVIARYGGSWRGIKPKVAYEHGAIGCIIYSDPRDDGYYQGDVYPDGPYRMEQGVQRGAVQDMPLYPGDPLTPFVGATADAERYSVEEAPTIMKIPVLPLSYGDALPLLQALEGPVAPASWRGALPLTYHMGPGPARVHMHLEFNWDLVPAYDIIAVMRGSELPDEWVVRGNHRDGWAMGAADPTSGMVALMEEARGVGELARTGWRPKRTMVYAAWDAEEPGLLGSTEWAEDHRDELHEKAVFYLNSDGNGRGFLSAGGSHSLERVFNEVAREVEDPQTGVSVWERSRARRAVRGAPDAQGDGDLRISPLGSGSDYTPFLQHLGITTMNIGFGGENGGGSYHSQFDSFDHYRRFGDPGFEYGVALAQVAGRLMLRFADADVLPLRMGNYVETVERYAGEVQELADDMREETERHNRLVDMDAFRLQADPTETYVPPVAEDEVPFFNFAPVENALVSFEEAATDLDRMLVDGLTSGSLTAARRSEINDILQQVEQALTDDEGLPGRPWFRHMIYAPGFYTGYGVKTLPGIREAIEQRQWDLVDPEMAKIADALDRVTALLRQATGEMVS
ncbi:MAG: transferrin receptor-like dimerization domain-containing protein [Gemmatimonadota bacterium]